MARYVGKTPEGRQVEINRQKSPTLLRTRMVARPIISSAGRQ